MVFLDMDKSTFYFKLYFAPCQVSLKPKISLKACIRTHECVSELGLMCYGKLKKRRAGI